jgi:hypothetical protein
MQSTKIFIKGIEHCIKYEKNHCSHSYKLYKNTNCIGVIESPTEFDEFWKTAQSISRIGYLKINDGYKSNGYGTFLVNYLIPILKNKNCDFISVASTQSATKFYEKNGFNKYNGWQNVFFRYRHNLREDLYYKFI